MSIPPNIELAFITTSPFNLALVKSSFNPPNTALSSQPVNSSSIVMS